MQCQAIAIFLIETSTMYELQLLLAEGDLQRKVSWQLVCFGGQHLGLVVASLPHHSLSQSSGIVSGYA